MLTVQAGNSDMLVRSPRGSRSSVLGARALSESLIRFPVNEWKSITAPRGLALVLATGGNTSTSRLMNCPLGAVAEVPPTAVALMAPNPITPTMQAATLRMSPPIPGRVAGTAGP